MKRTHLIIVVLLVATASVSATVILTKLDDTAGHAMTDQQRLTREKFFGSKKEPRPIEKGQEMRPRW